MARTLLEKTRRLNKVLQKAGSKPVVFADLCNILSEELDSNVYIASKNGEILGHSALFPQEIFIQDNVIPKRFNKYLLNIEQTEANITQDKIFIFNREEDLEFSDSIMTVTPINGGSERLGTLLFMKDKGEYDQDDLVLAEYSATVVGMEIIRTKNDEIEENARKKAVVQLAIGTLSYSELEAVEYIFKELDGMEGLLVASKIADRVGITRSVIVNALRKFESAGVIESRSLGMKGTFIRILNDRLLEELEKIKS
ncbi:MAG: GTP-sensing pleiotropic transcriptional regulator CodY [Clostridia bacterium]|nr:GTP-sensing pleiotropic transcriptional regulator CodY [Clostridia bacterium]